MTKLFKDANRLICKLPTEIAINKEDPCETIKIYIGNNMYIIETEELKQYADLAKKYAEEIEEMVKELSI